MKKLLILLLIFLVSCTHEKNGMLVKDANGNVYKLYEAAPSEAYILKEIDTLSFQKIMKH
jgi:hypothetical protein